MKWFQIIQIITAILLMVAILLQNKGSGLSGMFGGSGEIFRTKRGMEKSLFIITIILAIIFFAIAIAGLVIKS
jgi:preprotein translocase subunit SecG